MIKKSPQIYNTRAIYNNFIADVKEEVDSYNKELSDYKQSLSYAYNKLNENRDLILKISNTTFTKITKFNTELQVSNIKFRFMPARSKKVSSKHIKIWAINYIKAKREVKKLTKIIKDLEAKMFDYNLFRFIVGEFNEMLIDLIIKEGYTFKLGNNCGELRIRKKKRSKTKPPIDWKASNQLKADIIAAGKTPYNKETAPDGVKWFLYHEGEYGYYWYWAKYKCNHKHRTLYSFNPVKGDNSIIRKLNQYIEVFPAAVENYKT